ncbi:MAG: hypothetical protein QG567_1349 [Campylobacterota bacterium]|nr:hypothetical protein [Campylobacterota bacterium]
MMFNFIKKLFSTTKLKKKKSSFLDGTHTIGQMQEKPLQEWGDDDILDGLKFVATLQLRTPIEILKHHGEIFREKNQTPPNYAKELWHGIWLPKTKSYKELGMDIEEPDEGTSSSEIGYVKASDYVPFLIEFRKIVESTKQTDEMIQELYNLANINQNFKSFWDRHCKADIDFPHSFFYKQLTKIDGVGVKSAQLLYENGFKNIKDLEDAKDEEILKIKGIGKSLVQKIKKYCDHEN